MLYNPHHQAVLTALVGLSSSLASLELLKVPVADLHVATVLVHALGELLGGSLAVVAPLLLLLRLLLVLIRCLRVVLLGSRLGGAAAREEAADGVADGGANGNTTVAQGC